MVTLHRKRLPTVIAIAGLWLLSLTAAFAEVTATLSDNPVVKGQAVTLTIRVVDEKGEPDLSVIGHEFKILGQNTSSQMQYINGKVSKWKDWHIQMLPNRVGRLTIPAIPVGKVATQPLVLEVAKQAARGSKEAWIEFSAEPTTAWQGQQVLLTVSLYYQNSVRSGDLSKPSVSNAIVEQLGDDTTEQLVKGGVRYSRLTRRYLVFPEQAGELRIEGPVFNGQAEISGAPSRSFGGMFRNARQVTAVADDLSITVLAPPPSAQGFWLPAQDVTLSADWSDGASEFRVGEPVTRVVSLRVFGLLATQLPELEFEYPELRVYPEEAEQETRATDNGVVGIRHYRTALIPQRPGRHVLPAYELQWWDVNRGAMRSARLPEEVIEVLPAASSSNQPLAVAPAAAVEPCDASHAPLPEAPVCEEVAENDQVGSDTGFWKYLSLFLALAWLFTLGLGLWAWRRLPARPITKAPEQAGALAPLQKQLLKACKANDAKAAVSALAALSKAAALGVSGPAAVADTVADSGLKAALLTLDAAYYGGQQAWRGDDLAAALLASGWPSAEAKKPSQALPSLYPE